MSTQGVEEAAQILGIEGLLKHKPRELSGGQRQRVAVGRAIVREPDLIMGTMHGPGYSGALGKRSGTGKNTILPMIFTPMLLSGTPIR